MPISITEHDDRIYLLDWHGDITIEDIEASHIQTSQMAAKKGFESYIHILHTTNLGSYPLDLPALWRIIMSYPEAFAVLVVDPPMGGVTLIRMLNSLNKRVALQTYNTMSEAISAAHWLLERRHLRVVS